MPLVYERSPVDGALRQGEILAEIWEHRPRSTTEFTDDSPIEFDSRMYSRAVILTADCDLDWDFTARWPPGTQANEAGASDEDENQGAFVPYVLTCELYTQDRIRGPRNMNQRVWARIRENQLERYHHLEEAAIFGGDEIKLPEFVADFKKVLPLPTRSLYVGVRTGAVRRIAIVPPIYVHDLMHRFYGFLSRVGLPDP